MKKSILHFAFEMLKKLDITVMVAVDSITV